MHDTTAFRDEQVTLCGLFDELGIATQETDMSMSVRDDASGLEYAGARGVGGLFPTWSNAAIAMRGGSTLRFAT